MFQSDALPGGALGRIAAFIPRCSLKNRSEARAGDVSSWASQVDGVLLLLGLRTLRSIDTFGIFLHIIPLLFSGPPQLEDSAMYNIRSVRSCWQFTEALPFKEEL